MGKIFNKNNEIDFNYVNSLIKNKTLASILEHDTNESVYKLLYGQLNLQFCLQNWAELVNYDNPDINDQLGRFARYPRPSKAAHKKIMEVALSKFKDDFRDYIQLEEYDFLNALLSEAFHELFDGTTKEKIMYLPDEMLNIESILKE